MKEFREDHEPHGKELQLSPFGGYRRFLILARFRGRPHRKFSTALSRQVGTSESIKIRPLRHPGKRAQISRSAYRCWYVRTTDKYARSWAGHHFQMTLHLHQKLAHTLADHQISSKTPLNRRAAQTVQDFCRTPRRPLAMSANTSSTTGHEGCPACATYQGLIPLENAQPIWRLTPETQAQLRRRHGGMIFRIGQWLRSRWTLRH